MKTLLIVNPVSGRGAARRKLLDALTVFSKNDFRTEVYVTKKNQDATEYIRKYGEEYELIVICGGDGSLNELSNGVMSLNHKPMIGYLPSGTMNDFSNNFQLTNDWKESANKIVEGSPKEFDVGLFDGRQYFNYVAAFGAMCDVPYITPQENKAALGNLAYLLEGANKLQDIHPIKTTVKVNGKEETYNVLAGLIFKGYHVSGVELVEKEDGQMDDGQFNILVVELPDNIFEMPELLSILTKQNSKYYHWYKSNEVELKFDEVVPWTLDGEKAEADLEVKITNVNKALKIKC